LRILSQIQTGQHDHAVWLFQIEETERKPTQRGSSYRLINELIKSRCIRNVAFDSSDLFEENAAQARSLQLILPGRLDCLTTRRKTVDDRHDHESGEAGFAANVGERHHGFFRIGSIVCEPATQFAALRVSYWRSSLCLGNTVQQVVGETQTLAGVELLKLRHEYLIH